MPGTNFYDVIVIGSDPTGIMAGGLLRRRNHRTLLIGQGRLNTTYQHEGMLIPALPAMLPPYGHAPVLDQLLHTLGLEDPVHILGKKPVWALQIVTPEQRISLPSNLKALEAELQRAYPEDKSEILRILSCLKESEEHFTELLRVQTQLRSFGRRDRTKFNRLSRSLQQIELPTFNKWPPLLRVLGAATAFYTSLDHLTRNIYATGHMILALLGGLRSVPNFQKLLLDAFCKIGGELEQETMVEELIFEGRNPVGVTTLRNSKIYKCRTLLAGLPIRRTLELIPLRQRRRRLRLAADSVRPRLSLFMLNLILPKESLPMGMGEHLLMATRPAEPLVEDNLLKVLCLPLPEREQSVLVNIGCLVPSRKQSLGQEYLREIRQRVLKAASWLIPFLHDHLEDQSSPFWESQFSNTASPIPWELHQVFEVERNIELGTAPVPLQTPYRSMFFCGPESLTGLGVEGTAQAARCTAELVIEQSKLKKIL